jgi:Enoyl-(Acyl carrier protein) reductase
MHRHHSVFIVLLLRLSFLFCSFFPAVNTYAPSRSGHRGQSWNWQRSLSSIVRTRRRLSSHFGIAISRKGTGGGQRVGSDHIIAMALDVTDPTSIEKAANDIRERFGVLDVLVNNAGINYDLEERAVSVHLDDVHRTLWRQTCMGPGDVPRP